MSVRIRRHVVARPEFQLPEEARGMLSFALTTVAGLALLTGLQTRRLERLYPPIGERIDVGGYRLHVLRVPPSPHADLPPVVFIHGSSGNLRDPLHAFGPVLEGRAELLFVDRPGHGWSDRGEKENGLPDGQARAIAALMERVGLDRALIVGHSFGGAVALSLALEAPDRVAGLLLLASASHPWPGGITWYHRLAARPVIGWLFSRLLVTALAPMRIEAIARCVFRPNACPPEYLRQSGAALGTRPHNFCNNACDIVGLHAHVTRTAPRYGEIDAPAVLVTGDTDTIVSPDIHSRALADAIPGAELIRIKGIGHKPDYAAIDLNVAALEKLAGRRIDLQAEARWLERRLQADPGRAANGSQAGADR